MASTASQLLNALGAPDTPAMQAAINDWFRREGGPASNPLNVGETMANVANGVWYSPGIAGTAATIKKRFPGLYNAIKSGDPAQFYYALATSGWAGTSYANQVFGIPNAGNSTYQNTKAYMAKHYPGLKARDWGTVTGPLLYQQYLGRNGNLSTAVVNSASAPTFSTKEVRVTPLPIAKGTTQSKKWVAVAAKYTKAAAKDKEYEANYRAVLHNPKSSAIQKQEARIGIQTNATKAAAYTKKATTAAKKAVATSKTVISKAGNKVQLTEKGAKKSVTVKPKPKVKTLAAKTKNVAS